MRVHARGVIKAVAMLTAFGALLLLGMGARLGAVAMLAVAAVAAVDAPSFLLPLGIGIERERRR